MKNLTIDQTDDCYKSGKTSLCKRVLVIAVRPSARSTIDVQDVEQSS